MTWSSTQRYLAEFLGTFALLLFGGGSAVFSISSFIVDPLSRVILVSLSFGLVLLGLAYAFGDVSGGHFNPAVTLSMALSRRMPMRDVAPYLLAQVMGGIVGIAVVAGIAHGASNGWPIVQSAGLGSQCYSGSGAPAGCAYSMGAVFLIEVALTFVFVLVIQLVTRGENSARNLAPVAIGMTLLVTNLVAIPVDGASINPVRSFSPALLTWISSGPTWPIAEVWLFFVAPILGGLLASVVEMLLRPKA
ncbi:MAG TPA: aquaporin [Thermoplasmata archaeon]